MLIFYTKRFTALLIDGLVPIPMLLVTDAVAGWVAAVCVQAATAVIYRAVSHSQWRRTLGKAAVGIEVVDEQSYANIPLRRAIVREMILAASILTMAPRTPAPVTLIGAPIALVSVADALVAFGDQRGRSLHDRIAGSIVRTRQRARGDNRPPITAPT